MRVAVILNASVGDAEQARVREALAPLAADVQVCRGPEIREAARRAAAAGADVVVAAGGDGTVGAVASALVGGSVPLAVLPLGTFNHFAKDTGIPLDLGEAARALPGGRLARFDVGEVNGHYFVNNSSIGLYPEFVRSREQERRQSGRSKGWAMVIAALRVLRRFPLLRVRVVTEQRVVVSVTPWVFVGNNEYEHRGFDVGRRARLDRGQLGLYMVRCRGRAHMFWLILRALGQPLTAVRDFEFQTVGEARVELPRRRLAVSLDGEVLSLASPLHYRIHPGALPVWLPAEAKAAISTETAA
jgi:diacylglycerol kinase family enzyme